MSHAVQINYEQIAIKCHSICEVAETQAAELDNALAELESTSTRLQNGHTEALRREIEAEKKALLEAIESVKAQADNDAQKGIVTADSDFVNYSEVNGSVDAAQNLQNRVNALASGRLAQMRGLLDTLLAESVRLNRERMRNAAKGDVVWDDRILALLESIDDAVLRQFVRIAFVRDPMLSDSELIEAGKRLMNGSVDERYEKERELIRAELVAAKVSADRVEKIVDSGRSLADIRREATEEEVGEKVRRRSLQIIKKAITERGFIIDNKNIKINRETNEVTMVALKASGEKATFRVFLDGKFIYDFRGYEGQACQKDIQPFVDALEEVYGMKITDRQEIWSNPDKISNMKYQAMNVNKNKG